MIIHAPKTAHVFRAALSLGLLSLLVSGCYPTFELAPPDPIDDLDITLRQVASGDLTDSLIGRFSTGEGLLDEQITQRLRYSVADLGRGEAMADLSADLSDKRRGIPLWSKAPDKLMEAAYWALRARDTDTLARLYARSDFPARDLVESCKWILITGDKCEFYRPNPYEPYSLRYDLATIELAIPRARAWQATHR